MGFSVLIIMKYSLFYLLLFILLFGIISCGNDDGSEPKTDNSSTVSSESQPFVGYWVCDYYDLLLFDDGTCATSCDPQKQTHTWSYMGVDAIIYRYNGGVWAYDSETKVFSNSATRNSYEVLRIDDNSLLCIDLQSKETIEFKKQSPEANYNAIYLALSGDWKSTQNDTILRIYFGYNCCSTFDKPSQSDLSSLCRGLLSFSDSASRFFAIKQKTEKSNEFYYNIGHLKYTFSSNGNHSRSYIGERRGSMSFENILSPRKQKIILSGGINGTYYKLEQWWNWSSTWWTHCYVDYNRL